MTALSASPIPSSEQQHVDPSTATVVAASQKAAGAFRTISEVADDLNVPQHVLRFWETKFFQVRPVKRSGGRRYYRPEDVALLKHIHHLLYTQGYTIRGVQKLLKGVSKSSLLKDVQPANTSDDSEGRAVVAPASAPTTDLSQTVAPVSGAEEPIAGARSFGVRHGLSAMQRAALKMALAELKGLRALIGAA